LQRFLLPAAGVIGAAGVDAINRIFGLLVMAIGVEMIVHGINEHEAFRGAFA
jgi:small neutral amino acid transporter SnatA (MarC family)